MAARTIEITAEERSEIWSMAEMAYSGDAEVLPGQACRGQIKHDTLVRLRQWLGALDVLGLERDSDEGCSVPLDLPFVFVLDAAEVQALEVIKDASATLAATLHQMTAAGIAEMFLPPAKEDTEGTYLVAFQKIKAVRERVEAAEPKLAPACTDAEAVTI
jgi:hypothetical protein